MSRQRLPSLVSAFAGGLMLVAPALLSTAQAQQQRPNVVMLMTDDTGWNDFGVYGGGTNLGHATPNIDRAGPCSAGGCGTRRHD